MVQPGMVISRNDGDRHYVGTSELVRLYGLRAGEYVVADEWTGAPYGIPRAQLDEMNHLRPMTGPDYRPVTDAERESIRRRLALV